MDLTRSFRLEVVNRLRKREYSSESLWPRIPGIMVGDEGNSVSATLVNAPPSYGRFGRGLQAVARWVAAQRIAGATCGNEAPWEVRASSFNTTRSYLHTAIHGRTEIPQLHAALTEHHKSSWAIWYGRAPNKSRMPRARIAAYTRRHQLLLFTKTRIYQLIYTRGSSSIFSLPRTRTHRAHHDGL